MIGHRTCGSHKHDNRKIFRVLIHTSSHLNSIIYGSNRTSTDNLQVFEAFITIKHMTYMVDSIHMWESKYRLEFPKTERQILRIHFCDAKCCWQRDSLHIQYTSASVRLDLVKDKIEFILFHADAPLNEFDNWIAYSALIQRECIKIISLFIQGIKFYWNATSLNPSNYFVCIYIFPGWCILLRWTGHDDYQIWCRLRIHHGNIWTVHGIYSIMDWMHDCATMFASNRRTHIQYVCTEAILPRLQSTRRLSETVGRLLYT